MRSLLAYTDAGSSAKSVSPHIELQQAGGCAEKCSNDDYPTLEITTMGFAGAAPTMLASYLAL